MQLTHQGTKLSHGIIIDGGNEIGRSTYINNIFQRDKTSYIELTTDKASISVESTRELINSLALVAPISRVIWIHEADLLTVAAQNTLLKKLEEPPANTTFILSLRNYRKLLPTIISRCQLIHLSQEDENVSTETLQEVKSLMNQSIGARLDFLTKLGKDRESIILWLDNLLISLATTLHNTSSEKGRVILSSITELALNARDRLTKNGNITLVIGDFLMSLPKTK